VEKSSKFVLCEYGCGREATHQFKHGKRCCSKYWNSCPTGKQKHKETFNTKEFKKKQSKALKKYYSETDGAIEKNSKAIKKFFEKETEEEKIKRIEIHKLSHSCPKFRKKQSIKSKRTIKQIKKRFPIFSIEEEIRYDPEKPGEREVQVRCKNHNCINSKENAGWFTPTSSQIDNRIASLDRYGEGNGYMYCSDECKEGCEIFGKRVSQLIAKDKARTLPLPESKNYYTREEYKILRDEVFKRDNHECVYCNKIAEHIHHIKPQKLEPFFALDPDYVISVCKDCHHEYSHSDKDCTYGAIANTMCSEDYI
jgi:5-methylcytosine-specific restriction endonuclease McrA